VKRDRKSDGPKFPHLFLSGLACQVRCDATRRIRRTSIGRKEAARSYIRKRWSSGIILSGQRHVAVVKSPYVRRMIAGGSRQWPSPVFGIADGKYDGESRNINEGSRSTP